MLTQSDAAIAAWRATERTLDAKVSIADNDGNVTDYGTTDVTSIAYDSGAFSGDTFSIGSTYENNMTVTFAHLVEGLQQGYKVTAKIGIKLPDGTYEYCPLGVFIISDDISMDRNNDITTIKCYDQFCAMEGTYTSSLTYPAKVVDVIAEIANKVGVVLNTGDIAKLPTQADIASAITGQTYRVAIGWIAQFYGGFALFDRDGKLTIRTTASPDYILDPSQYEQSGLTKNEATYKIGGMSVSVTTTTTDSTGESSETTSTLTAGSTSGSQIELTNNIITQDRLGIIWSTIKDITFYPYSVTWFGNPAIEAGDWLTLKDTKGNVFNVPNSSYTMTFDGGLTATSKADQTSTSSSSYSYSGTLSQTVKQLAGRQGATGNYIYGEDVTEDPTDAKIGDQWYKKNGNKTELWQYVKQSDSTGKWTLIVSDLTSVEITAKVDTAMADVDTAKQDAQTAVDTANTAITQAGLATDTATTAKQVADTANSVATQAQTDSTKAQSDAQTALTTAQTASDNIATVSNDLDTTKTNLKTVSDLATKNKTDINTTNSTVSGIKTDLANTQGDVTELKTTASGLETDVTNAKGDISQLKQSATTMQSNIKDNTDNISSVTQTATGLTADMKDAKGNISTLETNVSGLSSTVSTVQTTANTNKTNISSLSNTVSGLNSTVSSLSTDNSTNKTNISSLQQTATGFNTTLTSLNNDNKTNKSNISSLQQTASGITSSVSSLQTQVNNSAVGTNLLTNLPSNWTQGGWTNLVVGNPPTFNTANNRIRTLQAVSVNSNSPYTGSISDTSFRWSWLELDSNGNMTWVGPWVTSTNYTFTTTTTTTQLYIVVSYRNDAVINTSNLPKIKFEKGSVATDYSANPADNATVTSVSIVSQKADSISQTVTNNKSASDSQFTNINQTISGIQSTVANKADSSTVTQLSNLVQTKVTAGGDITNIVLNPYFDGGSINGWVTGPNTAFRTSTGNGKPGVPYYAQHYTRDVFYGQNFNVSAGEKYYFTLSAWNDSTNYYPLGIGFRTEKADGTVQWTEAATTTSTAYAKIVGSLTIPTGAVKARIWIGMATDDATAANNPWYYSKVYVGKTIPAEEYYSQISQLADNINLRVQKNDVINQINVSSEGILIDGSKVHITGTTTIDNAVIKSAMIDSLSASKLTAGIIDANVISVINLNANNISTGTLTGVTFHQTSSGHDTVIDGNGINDYDSSGNHAVISKGNLQVYDSSNQGFFMKSGSLQLTSRSAWNSSSNATYGIIQRNQSLFNNGLYGMELIGTTGLLARTNNSNFTSINNSTLTATSITGSGIGFSQSNGVSLQSSGLFQVFAGGTYTDTMTYKPTFVLGSSGTIETTVGKDMLAFAENIYLKTSTSGNVQVKSGGFIATAGGSHIRNTQIDNELWVNGTLNVSGAKNAIVKTTKGWTQINAYETAENYFGDLAKVNTGSGSKVKVMMDSLFLETVNTNVDYHVFVSSYGAGYAWVSEHSKDYFIIESNVPNLEVGYEVKAKRLGYENTRLEIDEDFGQKFDTAS